MKLIPAGYPLWIAFVAAITLLGYACTHDQKGNAMQKTESTEPTVTSKDGTRIFYEKSGSGQPVILIAGALATHEAHAPLAELLSTGFTVYNFDRRGRGESGNTQPYTVAREIEDIEALINEAGGSAYVHGISSGASLALEAAAALGDKVKKLTLYEAPYDEDEGVAAQWKAYRDSVNHHLAANRNEEAVIVHMQYVGVPDSVMKEIKAAPTWTGMVALAPTIPYDIAVVGEDRSIPVSRLANIKAKTLVMDGGASAGMMPFMRVSADKIAGAIPGAQRRTIEGQAHNVDAKVLAPVLREFFMR